MIQREKKYKKHFRITITRGNARRLCPKDKHYCTLINYLCNSNFIGNFTEPEEFISTFQNALH